MDLEKELASMKLNLATGVEVSRECRRRKRSMAGFVEEGFEMWNLNEAVFDGIWHIFSRALGRSLASS